ncbi:transcriptional regulator of acetoin/glycerol metabolism [Nakamurella sp. UYEF19]|uniref:helix-turn-helix domain-containing protein n=1 Tax=Nakamurella sp. UYEF19 TaxID=1756392 RepID=UPI0033999E8E
MSRNGPGQPELLRAHSAFLETGTVDSRIRSLVAASWRRSVDAGINAEHDLAPVTLDNRALADYRGEHRLSRVFPLLYDILGRIAEDCECVMALGDEKGQLLWVCGQPGVLRRAEAINFAEGTSWDEKFVGTNAPGTALRLDAPVVIEAAEHFNRSVQHWSCAAAPIHDPATQAILGVLDITGSDDVASPQTLGMVRAAARMAEIELARISAVESVAKPTTRRLSSVSARTVAPLAVQALGRPDCSVMIGGRVIRLSPRHSEILVLLMDRPEGITGEQLEIQVYPEDVHRSTMRSEMTRLRTLLDADLLQSRPYRLVGPAQGDWQQVAAHLEAGRAEDAAAAYRGPLLPYSESPGVVEIRDRLHRRVRAALLTSEVPDLMASWTRTRWGAEDLVMWRRQAELLPCTSPLRAVATSEAQRLDRELGLR